MFLTNFYVLGQAETKPYLASKSNQTISLYLTPRSTLGFLLGPVYVFVISENSDHKCLGLHLLEEFQANITRLACVAFDQELLKIHAVFSASAISMLCNADTRKFH